MGTLAVTEHPRSETNFTVVSKAAEHELRELLRHRVQVSRRIAILRKTIRVMMGVESARVAQTSAAVRLGPRKREGITRACRTVLAQATTPLTVSQIAQLVRSSYANTASRQRDLLASVSAVLRSLLESGEANNAFDDDGSRTWFAVRRHC